MNLFDGLQNTLFSIVNNTMGYPAFWTPSGGLIFSAQVLFKDATETAKLLDQPFSPKNFMIEYKFGDFPGLKESVDAGREEIILVSNLQYGVMEINTKFDGKTILANLTLL